MPADSTSPLVKKLGIKEGCRLALVGQPDGFFDLLIGMPLGVELNPTHEPLNVAVLFVDKMSIFRKEFPKLKKRLDKAGGLWIAYPKKASKVETDLTEAIVQKFGLDAGLVDNKVCSIDDVWTGIRFVYRKVDR